MSDDDYPVCDIAGCPGYGTAHPPIEPEDTGERTWTVSITVRKNGGEMRHASLDELATFLEDELIGKVVIDGSFYGYVAVDRIEVHPHEGRPIA